MQAPDHERTRDLEAVRRTSARYDELQAAYLEAARGASYVTPTIQAAADALHAAEEDMFVAVRLKAYHDQQRAIGE